MHHGIAVVVIGAALDGVDQHVVGLSPGTVLNLDVITESGQIQVVHGQIGVSALAELHVIVTGDGSPHIQEADGIVVVSQPAVTGDGVGAFLTGVEEGVPLLVDQGHVDAHGSEAALQVLTDSLVGVGGVVEVLQGGEVGEHAVFVNSVVLLQHSQSSFPVGIDGIHGSVVVAYELFAHASVLVELAAVGIGQTHGDEAGGGNLTGLADLFADVVTVQQQAQSVADLSAGSFGFRTGQLAAFGQDLFVDVPAHIVGADLASDDELFGIVNLQVSDLSGGHVVDEQPVAVFEVGQHVVGIVRQVALDLVHGHGLGAEVVGVLGQGDHAVVSPVSHGVGAIADIGGSFGSPSFAGNHVLAYGEVGGEGQQLVPVSHSIVQGDNDGLLVGGFHSQLVGIALHNFEHVAVVSAQSGRGSALPSEHEVVGGQSLAVGPGQAVLQGVGVGDGAVFVDNALSQFLSALGNDDQLAVLIGAPGSQTGEQVSQHGGAVNSGVEGGIQGVRLRGEADSDGSGFFGGSEDHAGHRHDQSQHESQKLFHSSYLLIIFFKHTGYVWLNRVVSRSPSGGGRPQNGRVPPLQRAAWTGRTARWHSGNGCGRGSRKARSAGWECRR